MRGVGIAIAFLICAARALDEFGECRGSESASSLSNAGAGFIFFSPMPATRPSNFEHALPAQLRACLISCLKAPQCVYARVDNGGRCLQSRDAQFRLTRGQPGFEQRVSFYRKFCKSRATKIHMARRRCTLTLTGSVQYHMNAKTLGTYDSSDGISSLSECVSRCVKDTKCRSVAFQYANKRCNLYEDLPYKPNAMINIGTDPSSNSFNSYGLTDFVSVHCKFPREPVYAF